MKLVIIVLLVIVCMWPAQCDLPVHCLKSQVSGRWRLLVQKPSMNGMGPLPCGHAVPDSAKTSFMAEANSFKEDWSVDVVLDEDNQVLREGDNKVAGRWTMVYDEGFELKYNSIKYFAFSKYQPDGSGAKSYCDETIVGWYNNLDNGDRGCYRAVKRDRVQATSSLDSSVSVVQPEYMDKDKMKSLGFLQVADQKKINKEKPMSHEDHKRIVDDLNNQEGHWEAKVYDWMVGKSFAEINRAAGRKQYFQGDRSPKISLIQTDKENEKYKSYSAEDISDLPKSFSHKQYLHAPREQEQCGACYTISTMGMLSARLKMQGEDVVLSPQWSLNCNYYNQGCDGGYPFLVSKFGSEEYLVPENIEPYKGVDGKCDPSKADRLNRVYKVENYKYIGGEYGKSTERAIMEELMANGPVVMNFEPTFEFMYYQSGIYHSKAAAEWIVTHEAKPDWEKVDHSVLCFGWGEEKGEKYWLLQNSWGSQWGEDGNFRMRRGTDESALESMAESADPVIVNKKVDHKDEKQKSEKSGADSQDLLYNFEDIAKIGNSGFALVQQTQNIKY